MSTVQRKGRGFEASAVDAQPVYDALMEDPKESAAAGNPARSVEGWIVLCTNLHEEATEEDVQDKFADYGQVKNLHLNLDRRTGYVKGYALIEYETRAEAEAAIAGVSGTPLLEQTLQCDFAFVRPPVGIKLADRVETRGRSASPERPLVMRID